MADQQVSNDETRAAGSGRYSNVSLREARAAAKAQVTIDRRRGRPTPAWIRKLAAAKG